MSDSKHVAATQNKLLNSVKQQLALQREMPPLVSLPHARGTGVVTFPLSEEQKRLWITQQRWPENRDYIERSILSLKGALDIAALEEAIAHVRARHQCLRVKFDVVQGQPVQTVSDDLLFALAIDDMTMLNGPEQDREVTKLIDEMERKALEIGEFDAAFQTRLIQKADQVFDLVIQFHHIICDGWGRRIFINEVGAAYEAITAGQQPKLISQTIHYSDFVRWQQAWMDSPVLEKISDYWRNQLRGAPFLDFPSDRPRTGSQGRDAGCLHPFSIPQHVAEKVNAFCRENRVATYSVLLGAFQLLMKRYSGQNDVVIGGTINNRPALPLQKIVGLFANTIVLRTQLLDCTSFRDVLANVEDVAAGAAVYQQMPFAHLVDELPESRREQLTPFFQVMFSYNNFPVKDPDFGAVQSVLKLDHNRTSKFDLTLNVEAAQKGSVGCIIEYDTALYDAQTIDLFSRHFINLLDAAVTYPEKSVDKLEFLDDADRKIQQQYLRGERTNEYCGDGDLVAPIFLQSVNNPDKTAIVFQEQTITYRELASRIETGAAHLQALGAGPGALIGVYLNRSIEMIVGLLSVLKTGAAYLPLDCHDPVARLDHIVSDSDISFLITDEKNEERSRKLSSSIDIHSMRHDGTGDFVKPEITEDDLAYIIYTSGSTGQPKGVEVTRKNVENFLSSMACEPGIAPEDRLLAVTTISFDISFLELVLPLRTGATVVLASSRDARDGFRLTELLETEHITMMQATPETWRLLIAGGWSGHSAFRALCGGEGMPQALAAELVPRVAELWNMYGPTETTIWSSCKKISPGAGDISIGQPIANTDFHVLDAAGEEQPIGVPGELCIGGYGVARGYRHKPDLTQKNFFVRASEESGFERLYRTGDRAKLQWDGTLVFQGRLDSQLKIRGFRVEPGEIEMIIQHHPDVTNSAVTVINSEQSDGLVVAFCVWKNGNRVSTSDMRLYLKEYLPSHMLPHDFVSVGALPLTANGKIDRRSLTLSLGDSVEESGSNYVAPITYMERTLVSIWEDILQHSPIGLRDDFFAFGGTSLRALALVSEMQKVGLDIQIAVLFSHPTIEGILSRSNANAGGRTSVLFALQAEGSGVPLICLHGTSDYQNLSESLGQDQPVIAAMVDEHLDIIEIAEQTGRIPEISVERFVQSYATLIKKHYPKGPYRFAGLSFGGVVAVELAHYLQSKGDVVEAVFLIDTLMGLSRRRSLQQRWHKFFTEGNYWLKAQKVRAKLRKMIFGIASISDGKSISPENRVAYVQFLLGKAFANFMQKYRGPVRPFDGNLILLRAKETLKTDSVSPDYGWAEHVVQNIHFEDVPGKHLTCLHKPHVYEMGRRVTERLKALDQEFGHTKTQ